MKPLRSICIRHRDRKTARQQSPKPIFDDPLLIYETNFPKTSRSKCKPQVEHQKQKSRKQFRLTLHDFVITRRDNKMERERVSNSPKIESTRMPSSNRLMLRQPRSKDEMYNRVYTSPIHSHQNYMARSNYFKSLRQKSLVLVSPQYEKNINSCEKGSPITVSSAQPEYIEISGRPLNSGSIHYGREYEKLLEEYNSKYFSQHKRKNYFFQRPKKNRIRVSVKKSRNMDIAPWDLDNQQS